MELIKQWNEKEIFYIQPGEALLNKKGPVAATELKYEMAESKEDLKSSTHHFAGIQVEKVDINKNGFLEHLTKQLECRHKCIKNKCSRGAIMGALPLCESVILKHHKNLLEGIHSENCVRYVLADPLVDLLCEVFDYKLKLEENYTEEDYTKQISNVSKGSRSDYICYRLEQAAGTSARETTTRTVAVVMETKYGKVLSDSKCIAQVLGYYSRAQVDSTYPGTAILLSNTEARVFLFPFKDSTHNQFGLNSLMLPSVKIIFNDDPFKRSLTDLLSLILLFCCIEDGVIEWPIGDELMIIPSNAIASVRSMKQERDELKEKLKKKEEMHEKELKDQDKKHEKELQEVKENYKQQISKKNEELQKALKKLKDIEDKESPSKKQKHDN